MPTRGTELVTNGGISVVVETEDRVRGGGLTYNDTGVFIQIVQPIVSGGRRSDLIGNSTAVTVFRGAQVGFGPALAADLHRLVEVAVCVGHGAAGDFRMVGSGEGELLAIDGSVVEFDERLIVVFGVGDKVGERMGHRISTSELHSVVFVHPMALLPYKSLRRQRHLVWIDDRTGDGGRRQCNISGIFGRDSRFDGCFECKFIAIVCHAVVIDKCPEGILGVWDKVFQSSD